jgi:raffinose/stachyose/melibiose transport system substrate-binding protein
MRLTTIGQTRQPRRRDGGFRGAQFALAVLTGVVFALALGPSQARPAKRGTVTISMLAFPTQEPGLAVLISNFERVYPDIAVDVSYSPSLPQLETIELAAGSAPDVVSTFPGCGTPESVCALAKAGDLAPMVKKPWTKRSLPLVTSLSKQGETLYAFELSVTPYGVFTNDALFARLGLKVPQTFAQFLTVCQKARAAGTVALVVDGGMQLNLSLFLTDLAVPFVYARDRHWLAELKAGTVSFDSRTGWREALQQFVDMNNAGCFERGVAGTVAASARAQFANGQALMYPGISGFSGAIAAGSPQFTYTFHPFPGGTAPGQVTTYLNLSPSMSVNIHSSAQNQAAAQTFVDFAARPKQNADYAEANGSLTQYEFLKGQIPSFMSAFTQVFKRREYVLNPQQSWWNANVMLALEQDGIGLITGQESIDDVLNAMDAAWKQGPT